MGQSHGGPRKLQLLGNAAVFFCADGTLHQGQLAGIRLFDHGLHGGHAHFVVGTEESQTGHGRIQLAAQAVVADHLFGIGRHSHFSTGNGVGAFVVANNDHLVGGDFDGIIGQGLKKTDRALIGIGQGFVQGFNAAIGLTGGDGTRLLPCQCLG